MTTTKLVAGLYLALWGIATAFANKDGPSEGKLSADRYRSIQEALSANPGRMVYVPAGDYVISEKIRIRGDNAGLFGPGRIIQTNPDSQIIEIEGAAGARIRELTLTRAEGKMETKHEAVVAMKCRDLVLENLRVLDNRTRSAAIAVRECTGSQVRGCLVRNYMRISVDDRTAGTDWGYAFKCIDGTGIEVRYSKGTLIQGNRVIEQNLLPTPEIQKKFDLGRFVKKNAKKGTVASQQAWDADTKARPSSSPRRRSAIARRFSATTLRTPRRA